MEAAKVSISLTEQPGLVSSVGWAAGTGARRFHRAARARTTIGTLAREASTDRARMAATLTAHLGHRTHSVSGFAATAAAVRAAHPCRPECTAAARGRAPGAARRQPDTRDPARPTHTRRKRHRLPRH